jgi:hypothetical protein
LRGGAYMVCVRPRSGAYGLRHSRRHYLPASFIVAIFLAAAGILGGCTAKLAPDYERAIVDGLTKANEEAMTLFASVSPSAPKGTFSKREASYNSVIGKFEAVRMQVSTRPVPDVNPFITRILNVKQADGGQKQLEIPAAPTSEIVARIALGFTVMRDTDKAQGLPAMLVPGFKREYESLIELALTYEKQLQR